MFTVAGLQTLICFDGGIDFSPAGTVHLGRPVVAEGTSATAAGTPDTRPAGFSLGIAAAAAAPVAEPQPAAPVSDPAARSAVPARNWVADCVAAMPSAAVQTIGDTGRYAALGPSAGRVSDRCAALMGIILLGAGDPKLRFR